MLVTEKRVIFKSDVQETLNKLDARPGITSKNHHPRNKTKILKDDVSTRTRSNSSQVGQNVGTATRSKLQGTSDLSVQGFVFPLHNLIPINGQRRLDVKVLQLGTSEYKMYHSVLMNSKTDFYCLCNLHMLDIAKVSEDTSW